MRKSSLTADRNSGKTRAGEGYTSPAGGGTLSDPFQLVEQVRDGVGESLSREMAEADLPVGKDRALSKLKAGVSANVFTERTMRSDLAVRLYLR